MPSLTVLAVSFFALAASIHPSVAAPAVAPIVAGLTGIELGNHGLKVRGSTPLRRDDSTGQSDPCITDTALGPAPKMILNDDKSVMINGISASCMSKIITYNERPDIAALNAVQGTVTIINDTAIQLSGMPSHFTQYLDSLATKQN